MFVVIELQTIGNTVANQVWAFESRDAAFNKYHTVLAAAAISTLPVHAAVILDNYGRQIAAQSFTHEVAE